MVELIEIRISNCIQQVPNLVARRMSGPIFTKNISGPETSLHLYLGGRSCDNFRFKKILSIPICRRQCPLHNSRLENVNKWAIHPA